MGFFWPKRKADEIKRELANQRKAREAERNKYLGTPVIVNAKKRSSVIDIPGMRSSDAPLAVLVTKKPSAKKTEKDEGKK
jgi:hypothetical protein